MSTSGEYFDSPGKIALMQRSGQLWRLLRNDPRFAQYGRHVALSEHGRDVADMLAPLAGLQGASSCYFFPKASADRLFAELRSRGLTTDRHEHFRGGQAAFDSSRRLLAHHALPGDLTVRTIDAGTPGALVADVAALCLAADVMPVPGVIMRGQVIRGLCLAASDRDGRVVATASSYLLHHPASRHASDAFWGMLATREDRRGEKIALGLGARAIVHMWETHGACGFITGVRADNRSSRALCNRLGVRGTDWIYAACIDEAVVGSASITR